MSTEAGQFHLAGLHDLGKASPVFQSKSIEGRERGLAAGLGFAPILEHLPPVAHGVLTAATLGVFLREEHGIDPEIAAHLAAAVGGHHGTFPRAGEVHEVGTLPLGNPEWSATRAALVNQFSDALEIRAYPPPLSLSARALLLLAGITSVADWIASAVQYFPLACPDGAIPASFDSRDYLEQARARAHDVLARLGWTGWEPPPTALPFGALFPGIEAERPVQREVRSLVDGLVGPALVIVEAETGSGKTEAALSAAEALFAHGGHEGLYFALPTRATSDQMFVRVRDFLARRYPDDLVNLHLLHGSSAMSVDYAALRENDPGYLPVTEVFDSDRAGGTGGLTATSWFAQRKRGLLSPFAVGTVDQALLAVLQTRHQFVRLAGLAGKVVVIDEVHAYDAYMSVLLERLLEWLGALGTSVLLLSATLPRVSRAALARTRTSSSCSPARTSSSWSRRCSRG